MIVLALLFAATALLYASVGFGGGSTYTALLALSGTDYRLLPIISLACNVAVVAGGVWRFGRAGAVPWARALPLCAASVPLAWLGGRLVVPEAVFTGLLGGSLLAAGALMLAPPARRPAPLGAAVATRPARPLRLTEPALGGALGLLSGVVGIGGGIFLAPVLHLTGWAGARAVAGTASLFILVNSLAGLAGQLSKLAGPGPGLAPGTGELLGYWPLLLAVVLGGQLGARLGSQVLPPALLRRLTALLVLIVGVRLLFRFATLMGAA